MEILNNQTDFIINIRGTDSLGSDREMNCSDIEEIEADIKI